MPKKAGRGKRQRGKGPVGDWFKKAGRTINAGLKSTKILSTLADAVSPLVQGAATAGTLALTGSPTAAAVAGKTTGALGKMGITELKKRGYGKRGRGNPLSTVPREQMKARMRQNKQILKLVAV